MRTTDFMSMSHANCAMKASDMAHRIEQLEQIEANLCELHNVALVRVAELEAALLVARDALEKFRFMADPNDWTKMPCNEAVVKLNALLEK